VMNDAFAGRIRFAVEVAVEVVPMAHSSEPQCGRSGQWCPLRPPA